MTEEILPNEDKERLRRRLELLKREYERTAQRLQRAERCDAIRRHVQSRVSDQNRLMQIESSSSSHTSYDNQKTLQLQTSIDANRNSPGFYAVKKIHAIQFQLAEIASTSPLASPACRRSSAHRLRSKRSRLRLQNKERESDTDNTQEKERDNIYDREIIQIKEDSNFIEKENSLKQGRNEGKEKDGNDEMTKEKNFEMVPVVMEKNQRTEENLDDKIAKASQKLEKSRKYYLNWDQSEIKELVSGPENHLAVQIIHSSQEDVNVSPMNRSVENKLQSSSAESEAVHTPNKSNEMLAQMNQDSNKGYDESKDIKLSSMSAGLESCTLVEGLPFPVEYYVRTTRRMAASHSSVDIDAVIHSQLSGGRGRRRFSQSQTRGRGHMSPELSEPVCRSTDQAEHRGSTQRGKRGRPRRSTLSRASGPKAALGCPANDSQAGCSLESKSSTQAESQPMPSPVSSVKPKPCPKDGVRGKRGRRRTTVDKSSCLKTPTDGTMSSDSPMDCLPLLEPLTESKPNSPAESTGQSELALKKKSLPQAEPQPIPSPGPAINLKPSPEEGVTQDFKHLPDSQLYFDSKLLSDSILYPIFRRRCQTGRPLSQSQTSHINKDDQSPLLPSLASLIQALQEKDTKSGLLATVDLQDFHLPDEDFGQLKLERLRLSPSVVEPFAQRPLVHNTQQSSRCQRTGGRKSNCEVHCTDDELFTPEPLDAFSSLEDSLSLCQSDPIDQSQTKTQNTDQPEKHFDTVNNLKTIAKTESTISETIDETTLEVITDKDRVPTTSTDQMHIQTVLNKDFETSEMEKVVLNISPQAESQIHMQNESKTSSLCPTVLNLSPSLTTHTQRGQDLALPSLGMTPHFLTPGSPIDFHPHLLSPSGPQRSLSLRCVSPVKTFVNVKTNTSTKSADATEDQEDFGTQCQTQISQDIMTRAQNMVKPGTTPQKNIVPGFEFLIKPESETQATCISENEWEHECSFNTKSNLECKIQTNWTPDIDAQLHSIPESGSFNIVSESAAQLKPDFQTQNHPETESQTFEDSELRAKTQSYAIANVKLSQCGDESGDVSQTPIETTSLDTSTNQRTERQTECTTIGDQSKDLTNSSPNKRTQLNEETVPATPLPDASRCSAVLQEIHTFKALEGGCVLDLCSVQWPSEDCCICVAGEWSVCLWAQRKGVQLWSLLHTWTFAQSVMSLQAIPDSLGLLCVTLGHLEITEARVLCCPSMDGPFSQTMVCKDALQAVVCVSDCRLACCSTPGDQQKVSVLKFHQEGRVVDTLPLVSAKQNIRTLAAVEGEKDALIGWTECKTFVIWSMKSGHLLQTVYLEKTLTMTNCMRGYSYRGVLCVLLQNTGNVCDEESNTSLFTLIAMNPLTGKHITLASISNPDQHIEQLIDGDVFGSGLVGVFQSGHLVVWDLRGSVAKVVGVLDEMCRLARWAGSNTLLTGYLNGDVSVYHYKSTS
ncbi:partner and localizer of BRCA2 [Myxocyprinus asiaticus]|uniref:partner and localizer of BRCA2 n=1 Tax=Myxocyprinus asiaticus TaxID=70543 RepID=UPI002222E81B|nr:partner and localizer of BRCA2 [Myxocyprinus asiaticus]